MLRLRGLVGALLLAGCFVDGGVDASGPQATGAGETSGGSAMTTTTTTTGASATTTTAAATSTAGETAGATATTTAGEATSTTAAATTEPPADLPGPDLGPPPDACPDHPDLVACYAFDEGWDAELLVDGVGGHDGALLGATAIPGVHGLAAATDAAAAISVPAALAPAGGAPWTIMAWVRLDVAPSPLRAGVLDRNGDYGLFLGAAGNVQCGDLMGAVIIPLGVWTHVACVFYPDHREIYVDGALDATLAALVAPPPDGRPLVLANNSPPSADEALRGAVDEVMLWRRSLSAAEVCAAAGLGC